MAPTTIPTVFGLASPRDAERAMSIGVGGIGLDGLSWLRRWDLTDAGGFAGKKSVGSP